MDKTRLPLSGGAAHRIAHDVRSLLTKESRSTELWNSLTPLARNEWLCWIESAKQDQTRERRIGRMIQQLKAGKRRPCCWAGCVHR